MRARLVVFVLALAAGLAGAGPSARAQAAQPMAAPAAGLDSVVGAKHVLVSLNNGKWLRAEPVSVGADSLVVQLGRRRGVRRVALAKDGIARVWVSRHDVRGGALRSAVAGAIGGAVLEIGLGPDCADCGLGAGDVVGAAVASGGLSAALGAVGGLLGKSGWGLAYPAWEGAPGTAPAPYPLWSVGVAGGPGRIQHDAFTSTRGFNHVVLWSPNETAWWGGVEFGTLSEAENEFGGSLNLYTPGDTIPGPSLGTFSVNSRDRWAYWTFQARGRLGHGAVQPLLDFGVGSYFLRQSDTTIERDTSGVETRFARSEVHQWWGGNLGLGVAGGRGAFHPTLEGRVHWAGSRQRLWTVVEAGVTYR